MSFSYRWESKISKKEALLGDGYVSVGGLNDANKGCFVIYTDGTESVTVAKLRSVVDAQKVAEELIVLLNRYGIGRLDKLPWDTICAAYAIFLDGYVEWYIIENFIHRDKGAGWIWIE